MADTPVVLLNGARQTGKTTLAQAMAGKTGAQYFTLDDAATLALAASDPAGFIRNLTGPVVLDEIQKAPDLFPAIKLAVDKNRQPGRFLLTGSANIMTLPRLSESLAGRMEIIPLFPFSVGELAGKREGFVTRLFSGAISKAKPSPPRRIFRLDWFVAVTRKRFSARQTTAARRGSVPTSPLFSNGTCATWRGWRRCTPCRTCSSCWPPARPVC